MSFRRESKDNSRVKICVTVRLENAGVVGEPVIDQVVSSLANHGYCALDSGWLNKMVKNGGERAENPAMRELVRNVRRKYVEAGSPGGLFIVRACEMGLCMVKGEGEEER